MQKTSIDRQKLQGPTMGTRWSVLLEGKAPPELAEALQAAVDRVDAQMSTWKPDSDLMRFNAAEVGSWVALPSELMTVLAAGLAVSHATKGAFELNLGAAVRAWGFAADPIGFEAIQTARHAIWTPATQALDLDLPRGLARKSAPVSLDLSGIAKGFGVDQLAEVALSFGITQALCEIDGELRAIGTQASKMPWPVAVELPDASDRAAHSYISLESSALATSGDYRHFVTIRGQRLSHTIDPRRRAPLLQAPASVSVLAPTCMQADAMATALMVMGPEAGLAFAKGTGMNALFMTRRAEGIHTDGTGLFAA
jgi:FAD:protein FMN transferase